MLSNEGPPNTAQIDDYRNTLAGMSARRLASQMIQGVHNPCPDDWRNSAHPARRTNIRVLRPVMIEIRPHVPADCSEHNTLVQNLGWKP